MTRNQPFSNASVYCGWTYHNCDRCTKAGDAGIPGSSSCDIFEAIHDAAGGIDIPDEVALRFGEIDDERFSAWRDCPERVLKTQQQALLKENPDSVNCRRNKHPLNV